MSGARDKDRLSGWAAFGLKQRQEQGLLPNIDEDPFPPVTTNVMTPTRNSKIFNNFAARPFSEVFKPDVSFPAIKQNKNSVGEIQAISSESRNHLELVLDRDDALKQLKELYHWADNFLIMDVFSSAGNDVNKASALLNEMACGSKEFKSEGTNEVTHSFKPFIGECISTDLLRAISDEQRPVLELVKDSGQRKDVFVSGTKEGIDLAAHLKLQQCEGMYNIVAEPEWEEDDVYMIHRRDALRMMRSASRHSRAAANAFTRGDHFSAKQHAMKAEEDRLAAERLNARAARDILSIRNSGNGLGKLDLHGLHAAEAVQALEERLKELEILWPVNGTSQNRIMEQNQIACSSSSDMYNDKDKNWLNKGKSLSGKRPQSLEVITGVGNNSRGEAALPVAVRSFLTESSNHVDIKHKEKRREEKAPSWRFNLKKCKSFCADIVSARPGLE